MDDSNSRRREGKDISDHNSARRFSNWEEQCILEAESDSTNETFYSTEQSGLEQKLWVSFQNTASAIAQLYKDRAQGSDDMWIAFQNAAEIATNLYRDSVDGYRSTSELSLQCGHNRRNKEILTWAKKKRRHIRREDLIGFLCGRSPPHRVTRPGPSLSRSPSLARGRDSPDNRLQTFHEAVSMNGLNGAMAGISFGNDPSLRRTTSPARNYQQSFHPDLPNFLSDEMRRRSESVCGCSTSPSRKRPSSMHDYKPSSPKRRR